MSVQSNGTLTASGTHHGWGEHIEFVGLPDWDTDWYSLSLSSNKRHASAFSTGGVIRADSTFIGWNQAFQIRFLGVDDGGVYYGIKHLASDKRLTAYSDGRLRADSTFTGWNQAFRRSS